MKEQDATSMANEFIRILTDMFVEGVLTGKTSMKVECSWQTRSMLVARGFNFLDCEEHMVSWYNATYCEGKLFRMCSLDIMKRKLSYDIDDAKQIGLKSLEESGLFPENLVWLIESGYGVDFRTDDTGTIQCKIFLD